jgi:hypothetical protein
MRRWLFCSALLGFFFAKIAWAKSSCFPITPRSGEELARKAERHGFGRDQLGLW